MTKFNQAKFESDAKKLVAKYFHREVNETELSITWLSKGAVYAKAILRDSDKHYFDVTHFGGDGMYYLDVYSLVGWDKFNEEEL